MMKNTKKVIALISAAGMLSSGAAFAAEDVNNQDIAANDVSATVEEQPRLSYNGATLKGVEAVDVAGYKFLPLRTVAEGLGFEVNWDDASQSVTLQRGAVSAMFAIGSDSYSYLKTAPVSLGAAPTLVNGDTTYVPVQFFSDVVGVKVNANEDGTYDVIDMAVVTVKSVNTDGEYKSMVVDDGMRGEVIVYLADDTVITKDDGTAASIEDITPETTVKVQYSEAMTMSIPPQTTAIAVEIPAIGTETDGEQEASAVKTVTVNSLVDGENYSGVNVTDPDLGEVIVLFDENTAFTKNGEAASSEDVAEGSVIEVEYSPAMTASMPPQTTAVTVNIVDGERVDSVEFSGEIVSVDENRVTINESGSELVLNINDDTVITRGNDKRVYGIDDLSVGMNITGFRSAATTKSIPPQASALTIEIPVTEDENAETAADVAFEGEIVSIEEDRVLIREADGNEVRLIVSDETQITKGNDKRIYKIDDLSVGMKITGTHSAAMTFSIPPQTAAVTIEIAE